MSLPHRLRAPRSAATRSAAPRARAALGAAVLAAAAVLTAVAAPASAVEGYSRPAGTTIALKGHGYGHGHGMSQWGAYGAASSGLTWQQIMDFYYPGTVLSGTYGNPTMRVQLRILGTVDTKVVPGTQVDGKSADGTARTYTLAAQVGGSDIAAWRAFRPTADATLVLQRRLVGSSTWVTDGALKDTPFDLVFSHPADGVVRVVMPGGGLRDYRGTVTTAISGASLMSVNRVPMNTYLDSVVPSEMPASWATEGLKPRPSLRAPTPPSTGPRSRPAPSTTPVTRPPARCTPARRTTAPRGP